MFQVDPGMFQIDLWLIIVIVIVLVAFTAVAVIWGVKAHRHQASAGKEDLPGKIAEAVTALEPKGTVLVQGEQWTAISEKGRVEPGEEVVISKVDGLKLYVTKK